MPEILLIDSIINLNLDLIVLKERERLFRFMIQSLDNGLVHGNKPIPDLH